MCLCVCARARARVRVCVLACVHNLCLCLTANAAIRGRVEGHCRWMRGLWGGADRDGGRLWGDIGMVAVGGAYRGGDFTTNVLRPWAPSNHIEKATAEGEEAAAEVGGSGGRGAVTAAVVAVATRRRRRCSKEQYIARTHISCANSCV